MQVIDKVPLLFLHKIKGAKGPKNLKDLDFWLIGGGNGPNRKENLISII